MKITVKIGDMVVEVDSMAAEKICDHDAYTYRAIRWAKQIIEATAEAYNRTELLSIKREIDLVT